VNLERAALDVGLSVYTKVFQGASQLRNHGTPSRAETTPQAVAQIRSNRIQQAAVITIKNRDVITTLKTGTGKKS
jgi:hypothetical protein